MANWPVVDVTKQSHVVLFIALVNELLSHLYLWVTLPIRVRTAFGTDSIPDLACCRSTWCQSIFVDRQNLLIQNYNFVMYMMSMHRIAAPLSIALLRVMCFN